MSCATGYRGTEYFRIGEQHAWANLKPSQFETLDKGHGRVETRRCVALSVPDFIPEIKRWPGIKSIARIEAMREAHGKTTSEVRYLIGSAPPDAQAILSATRLHWGIENSLHRCLGVAFRENGCAVHLRQAAANMAVVRKLGAQLVSARRQQQVEFAAQAQECRLEARLSVQLTRPAVSQRILMLRPWVIPPTAHLDQLDPEYNPHFVPSQARTGATISTIMSNSFAFVGTTAVLVARGAAGQAGR